MALDPVIARRIRNLIPDQDAVFGDNGDQTLFTDENIEDFYTDGNSSVKYAAGLAKIAIGSSEALISKVITNYETRTDGAAVAKQWLAMGQALLEEAKAETVTLNGYDDFDIVPFDSGIVFWPEGATDAYWGSDGNQ